MHKKIRPFIQYLVSLCLGLALVQPAVAGLSMRLKDGKLVKLYDQSYALVIGVSDYQHWQDLPGVKQDIEAVAQSLQQHGFKVTKVNNPSRREFDTAVRDFIADYGQDPGNRLLFYFAGHGHTLKTQQGLQLGYFVPADAPLADERIGKFKRKAISMLEMEIYARQLESKHALFVFDSCFSGSLFELKRSMPPAISTKLALPVRQFITSGAADQEVPDSGLFRKQFVGGLNGEADSNHDGYITGSELAYFLEDKVTNYSHQAQTPQYGKIRDPILDKGDIVFLKPGFNPAQDKSANVTTDEQTQYELNKLQEEKRKLELLKQSLEKRTKLVMSDKNRITVVAHADVGAGTSWTEEKYSKAIGELIVTQLKKLANESTEFTLVTDYGARRDMEYDTDEQETHKAYCQKYNTDYLVHGLLDEVSGSGSWNRNMNFSVFNCQKNTVLQEKLKLDRHYKDSFGREISMRKQIDQFMKRYLEESLNTAAN